MVVVVTTVVRVAGANERWPRTTSDEAVRPAMLSFDMAEGNSPGIRLLIEGDPLIVSDETFELNEGNEADVGRELEATDGADTSPSVSISETALGILCRGFSFGHECHTKENAFPKRLAHSALNLLHPLNSLVYVEDRKVGMEA